MFGVWSLELFPGYPVSFTCFDHQTAAMRGDCLEFLVKWILFLSLMLILLTLSIAKLPSYGDRNTSSCQTQLSNNDVCVCVCVGNTHTYVYT